MQWILGMHGSEDRCLLLELQYLRVHFKGKQKKEGRGESTET